MDAIRYIRQRIFLGDIDRDIHRLKVAVIGLGGIGSWTAEILARMGVKKLILVDRSTVDLPDLHRQLYNESDIGRPKAYALYEKLKKVNSNVEYEIYFGFNPKNSIDIFKKVDIVIDGTDNLETRYLINETSIITSKPWIYTSAIRDKGYTALIDPKKYCFYDIFPNKKVEETCESVGIYPPVLLGIVSLQLSLLLDYLKGDIESILYVYNITKKSIEKIKIKPLNNCPVCKLKRYTYIKREHPYYSCSKIEIKYTDNLEDFIKDIEGVKVEENEYYIRFSKNNKNIIVFRNGEVWIEK